MPLKMLLLYNSWTNPKLKKQNIKKKTHSSPLSACQCLLSVDSVQGELTNVSAAGVIAERQHGAHCFGVSLLYQKLNDSLSIGLNQVLALGGQSAGQVVAD